MAILYKVFYAKNDAGGAETLYVVSPDEFTAWKQFGSKLKLVSENVVIL